MKNKKSNVFVDKIYFDNQYSYFTLNFNFLHNKLFKSYSYKLKAIGLHNIYNGTASIIAGHLVGVKNSFIKKALKNYIGVKRRFTHLGKVNSADIYDDYAHHPTEIAATLLGAKQIHKNVIVVFQPHRYSRTKLLFNDFIKTLSKINKLYLLDTYSAGEKVLKGYETKNIFIKLKKKNKKVEYTSNKNLNNIIYNETKKNNIIIFMGAGSISKIAHNFININA